MRLGYIFSASDRRREVADVHRAERVIRGTIVDSRTSGRGTRCDRRCMGAKEAERQPGHVSGGKREHQAAGSRSKQGNARRNKDKS